jgi:hypothetical protein
MSKKKKSSRNSKKAAPVEVATPSPFVGYSIGEY